MTNKSKVRESSATYPYGGSPEKGGDPRMKAQNSMNGTYPYNGTPETKGDPIMRSGGGTGGGASASKDGYLATKGSATQSQDPRMNNYAKQSKSQYPNGGSDPISKEGDPAMRGGERKSEVTEADAASAAYQGKSAPHVGGDPTMRNYKPLAKSQYPNGGSEPLTKAGDPTMNNRKVAETLTDQNYTYNHSKGPQKERGAITKNSVKNPAGSNTYPYGSGKPKNESSEAGGDRNMPKASSEGSNYIFKHPDGTKKPNPAMNRRDKATYSNSKTYMYGKDGTKTPNPAMNEERFARMLEMKAKLEQQVSRMREQKERANSLAYLIEFASSDVLEKSELVLAAKAISEKLQKFAEELATIGPKELMPIQGNMKTAFGPEVADRFSKTATAKLNELSKSVSLAKDAIDSQISQLEGSVSGNGPANDMSMTGGDDMGMGGDDLGLGGDAPDAMGGDAPTDGLGLDEPNDMAAGDEGDDLAGNGDLGDTGELDSLLGGDDASPAGRAKKESFINRYARTLAEVANPDAIILRDFRRSLKETRKPVAAAHYVAAKYDIDFEDVVSIVRESAGNKPKKPVVEALAHRDVRNIDRSLQRLIAGIEDGKTTANTVVNELGDIMEIMRHRGDSPMVPEIITFATRIRALCKNHERHDQPQPGDNFWPQIKNGLQELTRKIDQMDDAMVVAEGRVMEAKGKVPPQFAKFIKKKKDEAKGSTADDVDDEDDDEDEIDEGKTYKRNDKRGGEDADDKKKADRTKRDTAKKKKEIDESEEEDDAEDEIDEAKTFKRNDKRGGEDADEKKKEIDESEEEDDDEEKVEEGKTYKRNDKRGGEDADEKKKADRTKRDTAKKKKEIDEAADDDDKFDRMKAGSGYLNNKRRSEGEVSDTIKRNPLNRKKPVDEGKTLKRDKDGDADEKKKADRSKRDTAKAKKEIDEEDSKKK